jgi:hypothetical protein
MTFSCEECGNSFEPIRKGKKQKYCSKACRQKVVYRNFKSRQAFELSQRIEKIFCRQCGEKVCYKGVGAIPIFCNDKCKQKFHNTRSRRSRPPLAIKENKNCEFCGKEFIALKRDRRYCPDGYCAQKAYNRRKETGQAFPKSFDVCCSGCGTSFTAKHPEAKWCSKLCANRHWGNVRARQARSPLLDSYSDREIFERDGWLCHICGLSIDGLLGRMSPMGATIDHVFPIARGGLDSVDNVKAAHRSCNSAKGAKF